jgi:hypothetical protein
VSSAFEFLEATMGEVQDLAKEGIRHFDQDLRTFELSQIQEHFAAKSSGRIVITRLIKNLIWQAVSLRRAGRLGPIDGNLRSFFYQWVKPVVGRIPGALEAKTDPYETMLDIFAKLVAKQRLFRYSELDLADENFQNRRLGQTLPNVLVFAEKVGFFRLLLRVHRRWSVSIMALGGTPSLLSTQFFVEELSSSKPMTLIAICDWDPAGWDILHAQKRQLEDEGIEVRDLHNLIVPDLFTQRQKHLFRFPVPKRQRSRNQRWLSETGGLDGELFGIESDALDRDLLEQLIDELISPISNLDA